MNADVSMSKSSAFLEWLGFDEDIKFLVSNDDQGTVYWKREHQGCGNILLNHYGCSFQRTQYSIIITRMIEGEEYKKELFLSTGIKEIGYKIKKSDQ